MIPEGLCQCGCGERTTKVRYALPRVGYRKGQHRRFVNGGHATRKLPGLQKSRPTRDGQYAYRTVVARILGKPLPPEAVVHHINGNFHDNRPENLVVCEDHAYHNLIHQRQRALIECGHADWLKCWICKKYDDPADLVTKSGRGGGTYHRQCNKDYAKQRRERLKEHQLKPKG